jgi:two-component system cell cycle sensor histidine kinase/response regulator CckA
VIDGERLGAAALSVLDLDPLIVPKIEMPALLVRAFRASPKLWSLVEVVDGDLELVDGHPGFARFFGAAPAAPLRRVSELNLAKELFDLWLDCCLESWRLLDTTSCRALDLSTEPPRRLEITITPLLEDRRRTCCLCFIDEIALAGGRRLAADLDEPFRQVADTLPVLIWTAGPEGERDFFNRPWLELVGRSLERSLGEGWLELVHEGDRAAVKELWQDAYGSHESFNAEYRLRRHDGVYRFVLDRGTPRFRSDGRFLGFAGSCIDITERRRAEEQLQLSERYYRELIEGTDNLVTQVDAEGRLSFINPVCREIYGLEPEECIGFPFLDFVHPDDRDATRRHFDRWTRGGVSCMSFENRQVSRTGEVRDMLWTVNPHYEPHPEDKGQLVSINAIGQDITERKRSERVHKIQSQVLESMTEGVTLTNPAGFILYTNPAQDLMFGYEPGELIGQHFSILGGDPIGAGSGELERQLAAAGSWVGEFRHRKKGGTPFFTAARISLLEIDHTSYRVAVIEDISEQKKAEDERRALDTRIRQAQKLESLGVLAGGIAHDFNNLLMVVLGNASLALQDLDPGSPLHHDIEQIETAAMRASELTKQMLAYSGKGHFVIEPTNLSKVVADMEQLLRSSVARNAGFELALARELPLVDADVSQLRQVLMNLVSNAAEALGRDGGTLVVRTGTIEADRGLLDSLVVVDDLPAGQYVFLEVRDTGAGMDEAVLARVFDPFFTTKFTGRGLGLAAVLGIVRGHRGGIRVESQPGFGTTVKVLLPSSHLKPAAAAAEAVAPAKEVEGEDLEAEGTVLLVDDEEGVRSMAHRMLERLGFKVLTAVDGIEAVDAFRRHHDEIRLVLLDMTMPRMDGVEAFRALRAIRPDVKVILTSGYSEQMAAEQVGENGPAAFLQKPYRPADLVHKIDDVLDQRD